MLPDFAAVLVFLVFGFVFIGVNLAVTRLLGPRKPSYEKGLPYECGEEPVGDAWIQFNPRFYSIALVFLIFEAELAVVIPVAVALKHFAGAGMGLIAFWEIAVFIGILAMGLVYAWVKGDLEWVRPNPPFLPAHKR